jgi:hypothetical protein
MLAFLDIEASSLSPASYPIEIGWVLEDGTGEGCLIRPEAEWTDWDPAAEAVHGISRAQLAAAGQPAGLVAARVGAVLAGHQVVSDAPEWDHVWLGDLLSAGGHPARAIAVVDVRHAYGTACRPLLGRRMPAREVAALATRLVAEAEEEVAKSVRLEHRARADAERLRLTWLAVGRRVGAVIAEGGASRPRLKTTSSSASAIRSGGA